MATNEINNIYDLYSQYLERSYNTLEPTLKNTLDLNAYTAVMQTFWKTSDNPLAALKTALIKQFPKYKWMVLAELGSVQEMADFIIAADKATFSRVAKAVLDPTKVFREQPNTSPYQNLFEQLNPQDNYTNRITNRITLFWLLAQSKHFVEFASSLTTEKITLINKNANSQSVRTYKRECIKKLEQINTLAAKKLIETYKQLSSQYNIPQIPNTPLRAINTRFSSTKIIKAPNPTIPKLEIRFDTPHANASYRSIYDLIYQLALRHQEGFGQSLKDKIRIDTIYHNLVRILSSEKIQLNSLKSELLEKFPEYEFLILGEIGTVEEIEKFIKSLNKEEFFDIATTILKDQMFDFKLPNNVPISILRGNKTKQLFELLIVNKHFNEFFTALRPNQIANIYKSIKFSYIQKTELLRRLKEINTLTSRLLYLKYDKNQKRVSKAKNIKLNLNHRLLLKILQNRNPINKNLSKPRSVYEVIFELAKRKHQSIHPLIRGNYSVEFFFDQIMKEFTGSTKGFFNIKRELLNNFSEFDWLILAEIGTLDDITNLTNTADETTFFNFANSLFDDRAFNLKLPEGLPINYLTNEENKIRLFRRLANSQYFEKFISNLSVQDAIRYCKNKRFYRGAAEYGRFLYKLGRINTLPARLMLLKSTELSEHERQADKRNRMKRISNEAYTSLMQDISELDSIEQALDQVQNFLTYFTPSSNKEAENIFQTCIALNPSKDQLEELVGFFIRRSNTIKFIDPKIVHDYFVKAISKNSDQQESNWIYKKLIEIYGSKQKIVKEFPELPNGFLQALAPKPVRRAITV